VTLRDLEARGWGPAEAVAWMARSLGMAGEGEAVEPAELVPRFEPAALPREPTVFTDEPDRL
jgi:glutamyl-tRNA synthetase